MRKYIHLARNEIWLGLEQLSPLLFPQPHESTKIFARHLFNVH
jgi:hypothetical protein